MLDFLRSQLASEDIAFAVGKPFLEDLIAAELVVPDLSGDVAPEGAVVQVDVEGGRAEGRDGGAHGSAFVRCKGALDDPALSGHDCAARSDVAPAGGEGEILADDVAPVRGGGHGDGGGLRAQRARGDAGDRRIGFEQGRESAAPGGRSGEGFRCLLIQERRSLFGCGRGTHGPGSGPAGKRDARPFHAERPGVGLPVGRVVERCEDMVEQVFDTEAEAFQVAPGGD